MTTPGKKIRDILLAASGAALLTVINCGAALSGVIPIRDEPLFLNATPPPLNMLVMSRDHRMYYEAYNDASDIDGDGELDITYKPTQIDYYGYFDSYSCYTYSNGVFQRSGATGANKTCTNAWSGDWLNYMTTSRIDALRKVLYGGLRSTDSDTETILQRAYIPQDAHSWGKEYTSIAVNGYDITKYTPLPLPNANRRHLFANTTPAGGTTGTGSVNPAANVKLPLFRVLRNRSERIWEWVSKESPVAGSPIFNNTPEDYIVRVKVCTGDAEAATNKSCRKYGTRYKPAGLLQEYGENDAMYFGLLTGSYGKPHDGGVLRKAMGSIKDEIDLATGKFKYNLNPPGIIGTIDRLRVAGFNEGSLTYDCGWNVANSDSAGKCSMWGNPTAEMMYEVVRYFAGKSSPTSAFIPGNTTEESGLGLGMITSWVDPYGPRKDGQGGFPRCSKPFQTVISDISPSFDSDKVPGSAFNGFTGDISMNASSLGQKIWNEEEGGNALIFIGQSGATADGAPTPKTVSSFGNIRGLTPEAPTKEGSYYAASVAYYASQNDVNPAPGEQKVQTFAVALASPLPEVNIKVGNRTITLVPFAKSVGGSVSGTTINPDGSYQPTNQIVDFYIESLSPTEGKFRVNFEDVEQGADHDMDAIATYTYKVNGDEVEISVSSDYAAGSIIQHLGYVISGTTADGTYLVVRDVDTGENSDVDYHLDAPPTGSWKDKKPLPLTSTRKFKAGSSQARFLKDPLWYAAKWGGFNDTNGNGIPDQLSEWAANAPEGATDPDPDNYFLVTNALRLKDQLGAAFNSILDRAGSASAATVSSGSISDDTRVYQATFESRYWGGHLFAFPIGTGAVEGVEEGTIGNMLWDAAEKIPAPNSRQIITVSPTVKSGTTGIHDTALAFRFDSLPKSRQDELDLNATTARKRLDWLRGVRTDEGGLLRKRQVVLGDIVNSAPIFVGAPSYRYNDASYAAFAAANANRAKMVYVGANDGMLHAFDAETGIERWAFVPHSVFRNLSRLTMPGYTHQYYVDGTPSVVDAKIGVEWRTLLVAGLNKGGQGVYALDVTNPVHSEASPGSVFKWEFTDAEDKDLGYTYSRPAVVKMANGTWAAIFGNGYNNTAEDGNVSTTGNAVLYIVNADTGALIRKIDTGVGLGAHPTDPTRPNGLSTPAVVDVDGDGTADYVYAGDLLGNLWKFDIRSSTPAQWDVARDSDGNIRPLFKATGPSGTLQPITERPQVGRGPRGRGVVVLFGTGKFLESADRDLGSLTTQTFYGIYDGLTGTNADFVTSRASLVQQTILAEVSTTLSGEAVKARITSDHEVDITSKKGWYLDLVSPQGFEGEMQVTDPVLRNGRIIFTTLIPDPDICAVGGRSWLMDLNALNGARLPTSPFDFSNDGIFNEADLLDTNIDVTGDGQGDRLAASGFSLDQIGSKPGIVGGSASGTGSDFAITTLSGGDKRSDRIDAGPGAVGRQSWRQLR